MNIGEFIRRIRKERGITQKELAEIAGVSFSTINRIEKSDRNITIDTTNSVLAVFGHQLTPTKLDDESTPRRRNYRET